MYTTSLKLCSIKNFYMMGTREVHYIGGTEVLPAPLDIEEEKNVLAMLKTDNDDYAKKMLSSQPHFQGLYNTHHLQFQEYQITKEKW